MSSCSIAASNVGAGRILSRLAGRRIQARARGFAYIWTLLLVAFMGVGTMIASDLYATAQRRDKERELLFIGHEFRTAIGRYFDSGAGGQSMYPQTLEQLLKDPRFPNPKRHLRRLYLDPMTGKSDWVPVLMGGRIVGVHSASEGKPIKQDNFDDTDAPVLRGKQKYAEWVFVYPPDLFVPKEGAGTPK